MRINLKGIAGLLDFDFKPIVLMGIIGIHCSHEITHHWVSYLKGCMNVKPKHRMTI